MIINSGLVLIWNLRLFFYYLDYLSGRNSNITKIIKEFCEITITPHPVLPPQGGKGLYGTILPALLISRCW
jgi:hypothetical protein